MFLRAHWGPWPPVRTTAAEAVVCQMNLSRQGIVVKNPEPVNQKRKLEPLKIPESRPRRHISEIPGAANSSDVFVHTAPNITTFTDSRSWYLPAEIPCRLATMQTFDGEEALTKVWVKVDRRQSSVKPNYDWRYTAKRRRIAKRVLNNERSFVGKQLGFTQVLYFALRRKAWQEHRIWLSAAASC